MTPRAMLLPLLFLGTVIAQDSAPIRLLGRDPSLICHGKASDAADCVTAPHATYFPDPQFPEKERKAGHRGTVVLTSLDRDRASCKLPTFAQATTSTIPAAAMMSNAARVSPPYSFSGRGNEIGRASHRE